MGLNVGEALQKRALEGAVIRCSTLSGPYLLDEIEGYDAAIIVDAICTGDRPPGSVRILTLEDLRAPNPHSTHGIGIRSLVDRARELGLSVPRMIRIVAAEISENMSLEEGLSEDVAAAIPVIMEAVESQLAEMAAEIAGG